MPIRKYNPTSPGRRFQTVQVFDEITTQEPYKPLIEPLRKSGGRNNHGELTSWWRGGGHKQRYRIIDFKRDKHGSPAKVATIEYDPNRSSRIALLTYADGEKRYILQPAGMKVGDSIVSGDNVDILPGNALPLKNIPLGTQLHNVELKPGKGGQIARSAGSSVQLVARERLDRQGRPEPVDGQAAARPRRGDEPGRPPARRRRRQDVGRPAPGVAVGPADQGLQDTQPQGDGSLHRAEAAEIRNVASSFQLPAGSRQLVAGS
jgi:hypothetical protein